MADMIDLGAAAEAVKGVVGGISDDQLSNSTPCTEQDVATLLDHMVGLTMAFRDAGRKDIPEGGSQPPDSSAEHLDPNWREVIPRQLDELVAAWRKPEAWEGMTEAGGITFPAEVLGSVALDELVMHGWDIAKGTGQEFVCDQNTAEAVFAFTAAMSAPDAAEGRKGLFGPVVDVSQDAPLFERALGFAGRDPQWKP